MFWFSGSINEAIIRSKSERKVFIVFICGIDEISQKMDSLYTSLSPKLSDLPLVAIRLDSDSNNCKMFSKIYPVIVIPSTYFIDINGVVIEIIGGSVEDPNVLLNKINQTIDVFTKSLPSIESQNTVQSVNTSNNAVNESPPESNTSVPSTSSPEVPTIESKVERANQLMEALRKKKLKEEEEKERLDEIERRKGMKEMQNSKRLREDKETQDLVDEREREKKEAKMARDRVLAQIAADREERKARQMVFSENMSPEQNVTKKSPDLKEPEVRQRVYSKTKIQFRLSDGSTKSSEFEVNDKLENVRQYVVSNLSIRSFILSTTFPRREFADNDYNQTLQDLCLTPSAVLLVIPLNRISSSGALTSPSILWQFVTYLLTPFVMIWEFISRFLPSSDRSEQSSTQQSEPKAGKSTQGPKSKGFYKKEGNIARIDDSNDGSDDDNNTWNGNSTQQM